MNEKNVSKLILGTVQFGCQYGINSVGRPSEIQVQEILQQCKKYGINRLDTSSAYGESEIVLGNNIENKNHFNIISKYPKGDLSVSKQFENSLYNLGVSSLYGYLLHHFSVYEHNHGIWNDFLKLKQNGKVQNIGFSIYSPSELEQILKDGIPFDIIQIPHNIFDRSFEPYFETLHYMNVKIHVRSTFLQGLFFKNRNDLPLKLQPLRKYLEGLDQYSKETGLSIEEIALNYNLQNPYIDGVLIGVDNKKQLDANINSVVEKPIEFNIKVKEKELLNPVNWK